MASHTLVPGRCAVLQVSVGDVRREPTQSVCTRTGFLWASITWHFVNLLHGMTCTGDVPTVPGHIAAVIDYRSDNQLASTNSSFHLVACIFSCEVWLPAAPTTAATTAVPATTAAPAPAGLPSTGITSGETPATTAATAAPAATLATAAPTTGAPGTVPATAAPTTGAPATTATPVTAAPTTGVPVTAAPITGAPVAATATPTISEYLQQQRAKASQTCMETFYQKALNYSLHCLSCEEWAVAISVLL